jgi:hypothetical protein
VIGTEPVTKLPCVGLADVQDVCTRHPVLDEDRNWDGGITPPGTAGTFWQELRFCLLDAIHEVDTACLRGDSVKVVVEIAK